MEHLEPAKSGKVQRRAAGGPAEAGELGNDGERVGERLRFGEVGEVRRQTEGSQAGEVSGTGLQARLTGVRMKDWCIDRGDFPGGGRAVRRVSPRFLCARSEDANLAQDDSFRDAAENTAAVGCRSGYTVRRFRRCRRGDETS